ncbi:hypothetical protein RvY_12362 [Ramazzottius varieornatus]|uniref:Uncharacterized protein n=1 Tax=Ramazzottius varieornatus TaxID=947166 RepID=A0A1D1VT01_RAMVA|nr:hypothetical protein RvY_12362 [Ramazzottius varieornatus]
MRSLQAEGEVESHAVGDVPIEEVVMMKTLVENNANLLAESEPKSQADEAAPNDVDHKWTKTSNQRKESLQGQSGSMSYDDEETGQEDDEESAEDGSAYDEDSWRLYESGGQTGTTGTPVMDPPEFLAAQADFGQCERQTLRFFLEEYLKMCWEAGKTPTPQVLFLFQSRNKKDFLRRIRHKRALFYFPGNDPAARCRRLTDSDLTVLCPFLLKFLKGNLVNLDFRYNEFKDVAALADLITKSASVKDLNLMSNSLSDNGIFALKDALLEIEALIVLLGTLRDDSCKLEALDLTGPNLPDFATHEVFVSMCTEMLECNKHLVELHLGKAGIDDSDLETLMLGLHRNKTLRYLDLHSNKLKSDGARLLMEYLIKNSSLEVLDIDSNHVSNEGAEYLANAIYEKSSVFGCLLQFGRLQPHNLDVTFYEVDGLWLMAQYGEGLPGLRRWDAYMPRFGDYSHQACYDGFIQPHPRPYFTSDE